MNNKTYDILKEIAQLWLPGLATFYATVAGIWNLSFAVEIPATIMAVDTFLGVILKISSDNYNKTEIVQDTFNEDSIEELNEDGEIDE